MVKEEGNNTERIQRWRDSSLPPSIDRLKRLLYHEWRNLWKIILAILAIADFLGCLPIAQEAWTLATHDDNNGFSLKPDQLFFKKKDNDYENDDENENTCASYIQILSLIKYIGPIYCFFCFIEAIIRAKQVRNEILEMAALDNFEKKLARFYTSTRRLSTYHNNNNNTTPTAAAAASQIDVNGTPIVVNDYSYDQDDLLAQQTLRFWTPVLSTLFVWSILLPWRTILTTNCGIGTDTAIATIWITKILQQIIYIQKVIIENITDILWKIILPFKFWEPHKIYKRIRIVLRWVRYFRFAGPLFRMCLKLIDQFIVFWKTRSQNWRANTEKTKRIVNRSMLFDDIHRIESLTKIQTGLARVPSHMINLAKEQAVGIGDILAKKQQEGRKMMHKLAELKAQVRRNSTIFPSSEIYDRIVDLNQEFTTTVCSTLWSANLISPQTRFSVCWRMIVTFALLSELTRICTSYQLYGNVDVSFSTMMMSLLGCDHTHRGGILTQTGRWTRKLVRQLNGLPPEQLLTTCTKLSLTSHPVANFLLAFSSTFETGIDIVCFLDIFVWFFTGEIDVDGRVIPKSFFYRCILPGTLVQVLDHPTVPQLLPNLLAYFLSAAAAVGYSRVIRWIVTVIPAIDLVLVNPIKLYWFKPMDSDEWLRYTESLAIFPAISGSDIRYAVSHPNLRAAAQPSVTYKPMSPMPTKKRVQSSFLPGFPSSTNFSTRESSSGGLFIDGSIHTNVKRESSFERRESSGGGFFIGGGMDESLSYRPIVENDDDDDDDGMVDNSTFVRKVQESANENEDGMVDSDDTFSFRRRVSFKGFHY